MIHRVWSVSLMVGLLLLMAHASAEGLDARNRFQQGNAAYQDKRFKQAIQHYDTLVKAGYQSPGLFYNLGNAYYKAGFIPESILYYEKARKLTGQWASLQHNLSLARQQIADTFQRTEEALIPRAWRKTVRYWPLQTWGYLTLAAAWLTGLAGACRFWFQSRSWQRVALITGLIGILGFGIGLGITAERYQLIVRQSKAIITAPSVAVKSAPDLKGKDLFVLKGGMKVQLMDSLENWRQVKLLNGEQGWIRARAMAPI